MLEVKPVRTRAQKKAFAAYPMKLYKGCPYYVPVFYADDYHLLNPKKNPGLERSDAECWVAYRDKKPVGRICGIIQKQYNEKWDKRVLRFSRFECINDVDVAEALFAAAADWGRARGMDTMAGPWDFNDQGREGMLTDGFDRKSTYVTTYSYPYMKDLAASCGFKPDSEWVEYEFGMPTEPNPKFQAVAESVAKRLNLRELADSAPFSKLIRQYGHEFFDLVNSCYAGLDGYVPIDGKVLDSVLVQYTTVINPRYLSLVVNQENELIGVAACLADITDLLRRSKGHMTLPFIVRLLRRINKPRGLEMALIAVRDDYKNRGVNAMLMNRILNNMIENGIEYVESNPELVTNTEVQAQWTTIERTQIKRRCTFIKKI